MIDLRFWLWLAKYYYRMNLVFPPPQVVILSLQDILKMSLSTRLLLIGKHSAVHQYFVGIRHQVDPLYKHVFVYNIRIEQPASKTRI